MAILANTMGVTGVSTAAATNAGTIASNSAMISTNKAGISTNTQNLGTLSF